MKTRKYLTEEEKKIYDDIDCHPNYNADLDAIIEEEKKLKKYRGIIDYGFAIDFHFEAYDDREAMVILNKMSIEMTEEEFAQFSRDGCQELERFIEEE